MNSESCSWKKSSMLDSQMRTVHWTTQNVVTPRCWSEIGFVQIGFGFFSLHFRSKVAQGYISILVNQHTL